MDIDLEILELKQELAANNAEMWEQMDAVKRENAEIRKMQAEQRWKKSEPVKEAPPPESDWVKEALANVIKNLGGRVPEPVKAPPPPDAPDIAAAHAYVANMYGGSTLNGQSVKQKWRNRR